MGRVIGFILLHLRRTRPKRESTKKEAIKIVSRGARKVRLKTARILPPFSFFFLLLFFFFIISFLFLLSFFFSQRTHICAQWNPCLFEHGEYRRHNRNPRCRLFTILFKSDRSTEVRRFVLIKEIEANAIP